MSNHDNENLWGTTNTTREGSTGVPAQPAPAHDPVNRPAHYTQGNIECIDAIEAALGLEGAIAFCKGNVIKYAWRADTKGTPAQDMRKVVWYANKAADLIDRRKASR